MASKTIDYHALYTRLNTKRKRQQLHWNKVATRVGMSPTGLNNFVRQFEQEGAPAKQLSVESLVALLQWLDEYDLNAFLVED
jgi:hypothetical protein